MIVIRDRGFDCSRCGLCCRTLGRNSIFRELGMDPGNGICKFLNQETNLCTIYDERPLICRVDDFYEETQLSKEMSKEDWHKMNKEVCKKLQEENKNE